ncbi:MAG: hypothetical protein D6705_11355 [Deltaproteobacteria bacterium]|nr:MAG: hypothetical protein D6705_11355 [Deltaproteobacteria bacterium]
MPDGSPDGSRDLRLHDAVLEPAKVHVRLRDQDLCLDTDRRRALADALPALVPFPGRSYHRIFVVFDWDHRLPSELFVIRALCAYDADEAARIERMLDAREAAIGEDDLYPEFDVPDYDGIVGAETYVGVATLPDLVVEEFRLVGRRRADIDEDLARKLARKLERSDRFREVESSRRARRTLGGAMVAGWAPPFAAGGKGWAVEFWLLLEFDGHTGRAHVFCVDPDSGEIVTERTTRVQVG